MAQEIFYIVQGDLEPPVKGVFKDSDGNAINLTGKTLKFYLRNAELTGTVTVTDGPNGKAQYDWVSVDTDTAGGFQGEFKIVHTGPRPQTAPADLPIWVSIRPKVA